MKYLNNTFDLGAETGSDTKPSVQVLENRLQALQEQLESTSEPAECAHLKIEQSHLLIDLERRDVAWQLAREAFDTLISAEDWQAAIEACDALFRSAHDDALIALGQGVWLAVTFPIDPELTVAMLQHIVENTPADSDGAAVAAATAAYVVELRCHGKQYDDLSFYTQQMLGSVAREHSEIHDQQNFSRWLQQLELDQPDKMLVRLRNVVDVLVQDNWWIDRDAIRQQLPDD